MPSIERRNAKWAVRAYIDGKRHRYGPFLSREDAERFMADLPDVDRRRSGSIRDRLLNGSQRVENGCLLWKGRTDRDGYGRISTRQAGRPHSFPSLVHRIAYQEFIGGLDPHLTIDHTCHNGDPTCTDGATCAHRRCIEPTHLEQVTQAVNRHRAATRGAVLA